MKSKKSKLKKLINEVLSEEKSMIDLKKSELILPALENVGLSPFLADINEFAIATAVAAFIYGYNEDSDKIHKLRALLSQVGFVPSKTFSFDYNDLDRTSKAIYVALVLYYEGEEEFRKYSTAKPEQNDSEEEHEPDEDLFAPKSEPEKSVDYSKMRNGELQKIIDAAIDSGDLKKAHDVAQYLRGVNEIRKIIRKTLF